MTSEVDHMFKRQNGFGSLCSSVHCPSDGVLESPGFVQPLRTMTHVSEETGSAGDSSALYGCFYTLWRAFRVCTDENGSLLLRH